MFVLIPLYLKGTKKDTCYEFVPLKSERRARKPFAASLPSQLHYYLSLDFRRSPVPRSQTLSWLRLHGHLNSPDCNTMHRHFCKKTLHNPECLCALPLRALHIQVIVYVQVLVLLHREIKWLVTYWRPRKHLVIIRPHFHTRMHNFI